MEIQLLSFVYIWASLFSFAVSQKLVAIYNVNIMRHFILCKLYIRNNHFHICQKTSGSSLEQSVNYPSLALSVFRDGHQHSLMLHFYWFLPCLPPSLESKAPQGEGLCFVHSCIPST